MARKLYRRKRAPARRRRARTARPKHHTFTETFQSTPMVVNQDGISTPLGAQTFIASIGSISQFANYKALYTKYRITKLEWIICPRFGQAEPNQAEYNVGAGGTAEQNMRLHYRKDWSGVNSGLPANELDMLSRNGVRTVMISGRSKPLRVAMKYPVAQIDYEVQGGTGTTLLSGVKNEWRSFDDPEVPAHGQLLTFTKTASGGNLQSTGNVCADVFCKLSFLVANPR